MFGWVYPGSGLVSGVVEVGFGVVMGGISRDLFVKCVVVVVVSLMPGIVCSVVESLGLCTVSISSVGGALEEEENGLSFAVIFVIEVLEYGRGCLRDLGGFF